MVIISDIPHWEFFAHVTRLDQLHASENVFSSFYPSRRSVSENLDRGREYRPNVVKSVQTYLTYYK